jgi:hypothetical protein
MHPGVAIFLLVLTVVLLAGAGAASGLLIKNALHSPSSSPGPIPGPNPGPGAPPTPNPGPNPGPGATPTPNPGPNPGPGPTPLPPQSVVVYANGYPMTFPDDPYKSPYNILILAFMYTTKQWNLSQTYPDGSYFEFTSNAFEWNQGPPPISILYMKPDFLSQLKNFQANPKNKVMFSVGGATMPDGGLQLAYEAWKNDITATVQGIVKFVNDFNITNGFLFDGIDIDYEVTGGEGNDPQPNTNLLIDLTTGIRGQIGGVSGLPLGFMISHAPQAPYVLFGDSYPQNYYYKTVLPRISTLLDFIFIQFYNNPPWSTCATDPNTDTFSISDILSGLQTGLKMKPSQLVVGKPLETNEGWVKPPEPDAGSGYMTATELSSCVSREYPIGFWQVTSQLGNGPTPAERLTDLTTYVNTFYNRS